MTGKGRYLFRLLGVPIRVDISWVVIFAILVLTLVQEIPHFMKTAYQGADPRPEPLPTWEVWVMAVAGALLFFICVVLHELGHAVVAPSRRMHIRGIILFLFGGVAQLGEEPRTAGSEFAMAIAGPIVSLVLGGIFAALGGIGYNTGWPPAIVIVCGYLGVVNLGLLAFNLVPAYPLDGGRVLRSILWGLTGNFRKATRWAARAGQVLAWVLIAWGVLRFFAGDWLGGVWTGLIGLFLNSAARSTYEHLVTREVLKGEPVARFMSRDPILVPPNVDLRHFVDEYVYRHHRKFFPVGQEGHVAGVIGTKALARFPREEWERHTVAEAMQTDLKAVSVGPEEEALSALARMRRTGSSRLLVLDHGQLVGIVSLKDLLHFLHLKIELEDAAEAAHAS